MPQNASTLVKHAQALSPTLQARADEIEQNRFLPHDIATQLSALGVYHMCVPKAYGGLETPPLEHIEVVETLAKADGATAWCAFIGASTGTMAAYLPADVAKSIYGKRDAITAGVLAPMGRAIPKKQAKTQGFIVNGHWQWGSGCRNAQWIMGGCLVLDGNKPRMRPSGTPHIQMLAAPVAQVEILDTWHSSGLCGTGSHDFKMTNLFIPKTHSAAFAVDAPLERPLYAFPQFGLLAMGIAATALGLAAHAIREVQDLAGKKTPQGSTRTLANRPSTQAQLAEAYTEHAAARSWLYEVVGEAWDKAQSKGEISIEQKCKLRMACVFAARRSAGIVDVCYNLAGGSSVYRRSPLQRIFRDIHVLTQHMMVGMAVYELGGRMLLGLDLNSDSL